MKEISESPSINRSISRWRWLTLAALVVVSGVIWFGFFREGNGASLMVKNDSSGANRLPPTATTNSIRSDNYLHLYDSLPTHSASLIARADSKNNMGRDLWLRQAAGKERLIAQQVISARFSPDGQKIAYCTSSDEIFIETLEGERLVQIPRASNPNWRADSATVSFSAVSSLDYPELQQQAVYDLKTDRIRIQE